LVLKVLVSSTYANVAVIIIALLAIAASSKYSRSMPKECEQAKRRGLTPEQRHRVRRLQVQSTIFVIAAVALYLTLQSLVIPYKWRPLFALVLIGIAIGGSLAFQARERRILLEKETDDQGIERKRCESSSKHGTFC